MEMKLERYMEVSRDGDGNRGRAVRDNEAEKRCRGRREKGVLGPVNK